LYTVVGKLKDGMKVRSTTEIQGLLNSEIFKNISEDDLRDISERAHLEHYEHDEIIVVEGEPSDRLFLIINGIVTVKKILKSGPDQIYAYLMPGNTFGEVGILENKPRSASVSALSEVDVLVFERDDFVEVLQKYPQVTIGLAKLLGRYLTDSNKRLSRGNKERKVVVVINPFFRSAAGILAYRIARKLRRDTDRSTIFVEYPMLSEDLVYMIGAHPPFPDVHKDDMGVHVLFNVDASGYPEQTRMALLVDNLLNEYENIVVFVTGEINENLSLTIENTDQVILIGPGNKSMWNEIASYHKIIHSYIRNQTTKIFTVLVKDDTEGQAGLFPKPDFEILFSKNTTDNLLFSEEVRKNTGVFNEAVDLFVSRLEKSNQLAIFIPTTYDVNIEIDTSAYIDRSLAFLGERFGGATVEEAKGIWNSEEIGLIGEKMYKVHTYVTSTDLKKHLDEVVEYVKSIKDELKQEAMAIEINQKLTLI
jgi:CRP-like cAMP-binding protein